MCSGTIAHVLFWIQRPAEINGQLCAGGKKQSEAFWGILKWESQKYHPPPDEMLEQGHVHYETKRTETEQNGEEPSWICPKKKLVFNCKLYTVLEWMVSVAKHFATVWLMNTPQIKYINWLLVSLIIWFQWIKCAVWAFQTDRRALQKGGNVFFGL